jgi:hypothetical protein
MRLWNCLHHHVLVSQTFHCITQSLNYERAYPTPLMGRTNHYACEKKTDCTISGDAANTNNLLLFNGTDAREGVSQSDFNGRTIMLPETN